MIKKCSKCEAEFNCRHDEILECHCVLVPLSAQALQYIKENYKDCLCNKCLKEVSATYSTKDIKVDNG